MPGAGLVSRIVRKATVAPRYAGRPPAAAKAPANGRTDSPAAIGREIRAQLSETLASVMLTAADAVEANTPIQTGHLVSNWILSTGRPYQGVAGSRESVSYGAQDVGREKVLAYDVGRDGRIYLGNNVPYLTHVAGFVTESLMSAVAAAPRSQRAQARKMLKSMARSALKRGA